jgi:hypothetical protein
VLLAGVLLPAQECQAQLRGTRASRGGVKGFDVAPPPRSPVPGFGNATPTMMNTEVPIVQPAPRVGAQIGPQTEAPGQAASGPTAPPARTSYRFRSVYERSSFPGGVPEWFKERDINLDGQIFMSEYGTAWTDDAVQTFGRLDLNGDGVITARESVSGQEQENDPARAVSVKARASHVAPPVSKAHVVDAPPEPAVRLIVDAPTPADEQAPAIALPQSVAAPSPEPREIPQAFSTYADGVVKRFDADHDGVLTSAEWTAMPAATASADTDGDGRITVNELAFWYIVKR